MEENKKMEGFQNLYEVRKTVRFNLLPVCHTHTRISDEQFRSDLESFLGKYKQVVDNFYSLVFKNEDGEMVLNGDIKLRHEWLKTYTKQDFFENKNSSLIKPVDKIVQYKDNKKTNTNVSLQKAPFLLEIFQKWVEKNRREEEWGDDGEDKAGGVGILDRLESLSKQPLENQERKADFAYWIHQIQRRTNFEFVYEFFKNIQGKTTDAKIEEVREVLEECKVLLSNIENYLLPSQSFGQVIERASLNYYTVNKKPKDYPEEVRGREIKFGQIFSVEGFLEKAQKKNKTSFERKKITQEEYEKQTTVNSMQKTENFKNLQLSGFEQWVNNTIDKIPLKDLYKALKEYKAQQKSKLFELVLGQKTQATLTQDVPLFDFEDTNNAVTKTKESQFQGFYDMCIKIQEKSTEYEKTKDSMLKAEITTLKKTRGEIFDVQNKNCRFPKYKILCELFRAVAMGYGKIKAEIKSLEKEQIDAERLQSWALLLKKDNQHHLMTIPRDKKIKVVNKDTNKEEEQYQLPDAYKKIKQLKTGTGENPWTMYIFESLTLRALEKLCFGMDKNTFITDPELSKELQSYSAFFEKGKLKRKDQFSEDGKEIIKFYQTVLSLEATKKMILIEEYLPDDISKKSLLEGRFETLKDFQIALEKNCYIRKEIQISDQKKQELEQKYGANVYKITSYDLYADRAKLKEHTNIWKRFWNQDEKSEYATRLNPELKISYIEKREEKIKTDKGGKEVKNRRNQEEYILSMTISEHNDKPKFDMAFADKGKVIENIEVFNKTLNEKMGIDPYKLSYYGIDRGQEELLTLGLYQFRDVDIPFENKSATIFGTYKKPIPVNIEVWELPEEKLGEKVKYTTKDGEERYFEAYKNISRCENLLEKKTIQSCLDLTCAKLINGKIVKNGDIATLMRLKIENAKRKIGEQIEKLIHVKTSKKGIKDVTINHKEATKEKQEHLELRITTNDGATTSSEIYYLKFSVEKDIIETELGSYISEVLDTIKKNNFTSINISIDKINHLRDAICANAVGIMSFLQNTHFGLISFEDLDIDNKQKRFLENSTNLGSRVEIMLLNKFKTLGLVPPNYKMTMGLQSKKEIDQLGIIFYVKTDGTSSNCPHCSQMIDKKTRDENKWDNHQFRCCNKDKTCGFSTYEDEDHKGLDFLKTSDDVATYNIAKRGAEFLETLSPKS